MNEEYEIEMHLWDYIDGLVTAEEKMQIEELLKNDLQWKQVYGQLLEMHQRIKKDIELEDPSMRFTKNVMEEISKTKIAPATKNYINRKVITGIAVFFIILIVCLLIYGFAEINWTAQSDKASSFDLSNFDVSRYLNQPVLNVFWMCNVVFALILLDRYLSGKENAINISMFNEAKFWFDIKMSANNEFYCNNIFSQKIRNHFLFKIDEWVC